MNPEQKALIVCDAIEALHAAAWDSDFNVCGRDDNRLSWHIEKGSGEQFDDPVTLRVCGGEVTMEYDDLCNIHAHKAWIAERIRKVLEAAQ